LGLLSDHLKKPRWRKKRRRGARLVLGFCSWPQDAARCFAPADAITFERREYYALGVGHPVGLLVRMQSLCIQVKVIMASIIKAMDPAVGVFAPVHTFLVPPQTRGLVRRQRIILGPRHPMVQSHSQAVLKEVAKAWGVATETGRGYPQLPALVTHSQLTTIHQDRILGARFRVRAL
jgi:hypothetical protein